MVSVDDAETNREFAESLDADFPLLSNPEGDIARAYGVVSPEREFPQRWTFYIGGDGNILHIDKEVNPSMAGEQLVENFARLNVPKR
jgi:peroxiredoxin Q/BCP|tara:strand:- start:2859 stop:3119 length:261 start_codon:yes stop_codon:yes gene_type:complete